GNPRWTYHSNDPSDAPASGEPATAGGVGQPGFVEGLIPIWGSGRAAVDDFQNGRYGWAAFNTAMAVTDVAGGALIKGAAKLGGKVIGKVGPKFMCFATQTGCFFAGTLVATE